MQSLRLIIGTSSLKEKHPDIALGACRRLLNRPYSVAKEYEPYIVKYIANFGPFQDAEFAVLSFACTNCSLLGATIACCLRNTRRAVGCYFASPFSYLIALYDELCHIALGLMAGNSSSL